MKKSVIIEDGIAGLSTGCHGQMNGYSTEICELNNIPGGCVPHGSVEDILLMVVGRVRCSPRTKIRNL